MDPIELWMYRTLIIAIIGFAIWVGQKLINKVDKLSDTIASLTIALSMNGKDMENLQTNCGKREAEVNRRFGEQAETIEDHEKRIRHLEQ